MPSPPAWGSPIGTPERSGSSLFTRRHPQQRGAERVPSPHPYLQSPVRHGQTAQDAMHVGMQQEQAVGLLPRSEWQTQTVDVERTIIEPMALRHTVPKKRLVSRTYATSCGTPQVVLEQETYYTTEMRVVDVSVTVVQQEKREVLATVWEPEQRPLQQRAADFPLARTVSAGEVIDERSMVGAPGSTDWRFQNRTAGSTTARSRTPSKCPRRNPFLRRRVNHCCAFPAVFTDVCALWACSELSQHTLSVKLVVENGARRDDGRVADAASKGPAGTACRPFGTAVWHSSSA